MESILPGVVITPIDIYRDNRGSLLELFRSDLLDNVPVMGYLSYTLPGVARGPHEHRYQTDIFVFVDGLVQLKLWDNRPTTRTKSNLTLMVGKDSPVRVIIPPGIVHGYRNLGISPVLILNFPDKLYKGPGKKEEIDEIRYEDNMNTPFIL